MKSQSNSYISLHIDYLNPSQIMLFLVVLVIQVPIIEVLIYIVLVLDYIIHNEIVKP